MVVPVVGNAGEENGIIVVDFEQNPGGLAGI
jgi:hypothetical protein